jgi:tetratricopeptide (TPR) repeat protein
MLFNFLKHVFNRQDNSLERDGIQIASDLVRQRQYDEALRLLDSLLEFKPTWAEALALRGSIYRIQGRNKEAITDLLRVADSVSAAAPLHELSLAYSASGDRERALQYCDRALAVDPTSVELRALKASILMPGEDYFRLLKRIHQHLQPATYVEIGVFRGESLGLVDSSTTAIGIDPDPKLSGPLGANQRIFQETSDDFFAHHDLRTELGDRRLELGFIDGMHHFEFAFRDFVNLERYCVPTGTILIHDCYPLDAYTARRDGEPPFWTGDVWRLVVLLKKYRPDLSVQTVAAPPSGLAIIRNLDPESKLLTERMKEIVDEMLRLDYSDLEREARERLNVIPNEWSVVRQALST